MAEYRNLAYTSPGGTRLEFVYNGDITDEVQHNLGEFQFSNVDGKYYQDRSITTGAYPFVVILAGADAQDQLREVRALFEEKVTIDNPGILEHPDPTLGTFPVVVAGYKPIQNAIRARNVIRVEVNFFRQIPNLIGGDPSETDNPASAASTAAAIADLNTDQAQDLENTIDDSTGRGFAAFVESAISVAQGAQAALGSLAAQVDEINIRFTNTFAEIISTADELARAPFTLARQIQNLIQLPMLAVDSVRDRVAAYQDYVNETIEFSESDLNEIAAGSAAGKNILATKGLAALAAVSAINYSAVSGQAVTLDQIITGDPLTENGYLSRQQIIDTIGAVQGSALQVTDTISGKAADFGADIFFNQYFDYSILNKNLITATVRNLNARVFSANQERRFVTEIEENVVPLCGRLYNSVQLNTIKFLIESNSLHGDEIYLVPEGKEIVYYGL